MVFYISYTFSLGSYILFEEFKVNNIYYWINGEIEKN